LTLFRYKTSGNNNNDLDWLATQVKQCPTTDFRALCGIFDIAMADLLQHYQVKDPLSKLELMAKIRAVSSASGQEVCIMTQIDSRLCSEIGTSKICHKGRD
jgi:hypothetical protein